MQVSLPLRRAQHSPSQQYSQPEVPMGRWQTLQGRMLQVLTYAECR